MPFGVAAEPVGKLRSCRGLGLRLGLCALPWRVAAHFVAQACDEKVGDLQVFPAMARPGLEPGTPRFSGSPGAAILSHKRPANQTVPVCAVPTRCRRLRPVARAFGTLLGCGSPNEPWRRGASRTSRLTLVPCVAAARASAPSRAKHRLRCWACAMPGSRTGAASHGSAPRRRDRCSSHACGGDAGVSWHAETTASRSAAGAARTGLRCSRVSKSERAERSAVPTLDSSVDWRWSRVPNGGTGGLVCVVPVLRSHRAHHESETNWMSAKSPSVESATSSWPRSGSCCRRRPKSRPDFASMVLIGN